VWNNISNNVGNTNDLLVRGAEQEIGQSKYETESEFGVNLGIETTAYANG